MAESTDSLKTSIITIGEGVKLCVTDLLTRDLMLEAVPYSVVNILFVCEIWDSTR